MFGKRMKTGNIFSPTLAVLLLVMCVSCTIKKDESFFDTINGTLHVDAPKYVLPNQLVKITGEGLNWPIEAQYRWTVSGSDEYPDTLVGNPIYLRFPDSAASYTVLLSIYNKDFFENFAFASITVLDTAAANHSLTGRDFGPDVIVDPRDLTTYHTTKVGQLEWFSENLAYGNDSIGKDYPEAEVLKYFFGRLYSWDEATGGESKSGLGNGPQGACPPGWSIPTMEDWEDLGAAINGGEPVSFLKTWKDIGQNISVEAYFRGNKIWPYSPDHTHMNMFNWNAIPTGYSVLDNSIATYMGNYGLWWCSTERDSSSAYYRYIYSEVPDFYVSYSNKDDLRIPVRCVRKINQ